MHLTKEQTEEFSKLAKPLIKWLNDNVHPNSHIILTTDSAEVTETMFCTFTKEFIRD